MAGFTKKLAFDNNEIAFALRDMIYRAVVSAYKVRPEISLTHYPVEIASYKDLPDELLKIRPIISARRKAIVKARHTLSPQLTVS
jgi:hypothetical protein